MIRLFLFSTSFSLLERILNSIRPSVYQQPFLVQQMSNAEISFRWPAPYFCLPLITPELLYKALVPSLFFKFQVLFFGGMTL